MESKSRIMVGKSEVLDHRLRIILHANAIRNIPPQVDRLHTPTTVPTYWLKDESPERRSSILEVGWHMLTDLVVLTDWSISTVLCSCVVIVDYANTQKCNTKVLC